MEHLTPHTTEVEQIVLGSTLIDQYCIPAVIALLTPGAFYHQQNETIYREILSMYNAGKPVDIVTITTSLRESCKLDKIGGATYITKLTDRIASTANIEEHCRILQEYQIKRVIIDAARKAIIQADDPVTDPFDCLTSLEKSVSSISEIIASGGNLMPLSMILNDVEDCIKKREENRRLGKTVGIPTGLKALDKHTKGWKNGELVILAGRPSMGKSALMLHFVLNAGCNACIYSLEMPKISLGDRLILSMSNIDPEKYAVGDMTSDDWQRFEKAKRTLQSMPIYIDDNSMVSTRYIRAHSKLMKDRGQCDIIFVDYLQLTDTRTDQSGRSREQEVSQASREFKIMAKTLNVPVVVLSQLSRAVETRSDRRPMLSDLRESGAIEQDADVVIFAYRPEYYGIKQDENGNSTHGIGMAIIAKGRNIGTGEVIFGYNENMTKITDVDRSMISGYDNENEQPF